MFDSNVNLSVVGNLGKSRLNCFLIILQIKELNVAEDIFLIHKIVLSLSKCPFGVILGRCQPHFKCNIRPRVELIHTNSDSLLRCNPQSVTIPKGNLQ